MNARPQISEASRRPWLRPSRQGSHDSLLNPSLLEAGRPTLTDLGKLVNLALPEAQRSTAAWSSSRMR
jgi:hypothetical protein